MGIDVYLEWDEMTKEEKEKQYTGFSVVSGDVGYLREAYHGGPYATRVLVKEDWDKQPKDGFRISNAVLRKRMPEVEDAVVERQKAVYNEDEENELTLEIVESFRNFVKLHGMMEKNGRNPRIIISY